MKTETASFAPAPSSWQPPAEDDFSRVINTYQWEEALRILAADPSLVDAIPQGQFYYLFFHAMRSDSTSAETCWNLLLAQTDRIERMTRIQFDNLIVPLEVDPPEEHLASDQLIAARKIQLLQLDLAVRFSLDALIALQDDYREKGSPIPHILSQLIEEKTEEQNAKRCSFWPLFNRPTSHND